MTILNCKSNCEGWQKAWPNGYKVVSYNEIYAKWTHCPYCNSGKLVDRDEETKNRLRDCIINRVNSESQTYCLIKTLLQNFNITPKEQD